MRSKRKRTATMRMKSKSQGGATLLIVLASTLIMLLVSNFILTPLSQSSLFLAHAQSAKTAQNAESDVFSSVQNLAKKLRDVKGEKIPNQYIVVLNDKNLLPSSSVNSLASQAKNQGAVLRHVYDKVLDGFAIRVPNEKVLDAILNIPQVAYVEPDIKVKAFAQSLPTGINRVDADLSSTKSGDGTGAVNVDIGIMDTGIDLNHPDLNVYKQVTFVSGTVNGNDDNGHGTSVAGIAAAKDDSQGVVGVAPGARLWSIKVLNSNGNGLISDIIEGIDYVTQHANEIDAVNLSFGAVGSSTALHSAIINSVAAGVTYAAAGGNDGNDASSTIPASYPEVIAVSATVDTDGKCGGLSVGTPAGSDDTLADFSNFGSVIDIAAPGVLIKTTAWPSSYTDSFSGTSASTPHVTGAAALYKSENPGASPSNVRDALRNSGSTPTTICDGNGHGYFTGDPDNIAEPLLYLASATTLPPASCTTNLPISAATASGSQAGLPPTNAIDNNFGTRWSNSLRGSTITVDLGSAQSICSVDIAWYSGNTRQYHFVISTSTDGTTFTNRFSGDSSGTTVNSEKYSFASASARYVKVTVNGNTQNSYASMYEIDVFGSSSLLPAPPVANDQPVTTNKNTAKSITLTASDPNNDPLTYTVVTQPAHGTVTTGTGAVRTYTPTTGYTGPDSFTFKANDGTADSNIATVSITVQDTGACTTNLPISAVTASGSQAGLPPTNAIDNNFGTRWSNSLRGSTITVDLGSAQSICSVDIAWYSGNTRQYHFVIATSTDGNSFSNQFSGDSSGTTVNSEKYSFASASARYVKVTVNGNTQNSYASIYEIDIFGSSSSLAGSSLYYYGPSLTLSGQ